MAQKLSEDERRKLAADFDPPPAKKTRSAPSLTTGKRIRVTASLTPAQYETLKKLAKKRGLSMSRMLGESITALYENA